MCRKHWPVISGSTTVLQVVLCLLSCQQIATRAHFLGVSAAAQRVSPPREPVESSFTWCLLSRKVCFWFSQYVCHSCLLAKGSDQHFGCHVSNQIVCYYRRKTLLQASLVARKRLHATGEGGPLHILVLGRYSSNSSRPRRTYVVLVAELVLNFSLFFFILFSVSLSRFSSGKAVSHINTDIEKESSRRMIPSMSK